MRNILLCIAACLMLAGCATWLETPDESAIKVDPIDTKYVEAETNLKNAYRVLTQLADRELAARAAGRPVGSVISKVDYDSAFNKLNSAKRILRDGRAMTGTCLETAAYNLDLSGCLSREQIALAVLSILTKFNERTAQ